MKKAMVSYAAASVIYTTVFLYLVSCTGDKCPLHSEPAYHYIKFTMNGPGYTLDENEITFNYGPNYSNEEPIAFLSDNAILMYGCSCWEANLDVEIVLFLSCGLYPNTPGEHIGTYGDEVTDIGTCSIGFHITEEQKYFYTSNDIIVTITSFGDVGEDVEGNFSCTLEYVNAAATSFGSPLTVIGEFRVLRAAEDVYPPPPV